MRLIVVQRGRLRDTQVIALRDEYRRRFRRYGELHIEERTGRAARETIWPRVAGWRVLLDERGEQYSSDELARHLERWTMQHGPLAFAIGDADGHHPDTVADADARWALSALTLPHQLAHLLVCEQLYRAGSITHGDPYHHAF